MGRSEGSEKLRPGALTGGIGTMRLTTEPSNALKLRRGWPGAGENSQRGTSRSVGEAASYGRLSGRYPSLHATRWIRRCQHLLDFDCQPVGIERLLDEACPLPQNP